MTIVEDVRCLVAPGGCARRSAGIASLRAIDSDVRAVGQDRRLGRRRGGREHRDDQQLVEARAEDSMADRGEDVRPGSR